MAGYEHAVELEDASIEDAQFLRSYAERLEAPTGTASGDRAGDPERALPVEPADLHRRLFLPASGDGSRDDAYRALRELARQPARAGPVLERAWLILGTAYIERQLGAGIPPDRLDAMAALVRRYSQVLNDACFDTSPAPPPPPPQVDPNDPGHRALLDGFQRYLEGAGGMEPPRVYASLGAVPLECEAAVEEVGPAQVGVRVSAMHIDALARRGLGVVHSPVHGFSMQAHARRVDRRRRVVWFSSLERLDAPRGRPAAGSVGTGDPVEVRVRSGGDELTGRLIDIGEDGFTAYFRHVDAATYVEGAMVGCEIVLPSPADRSSCAIALRGRIGQTQSAPQGETDAWRIVVHLQVEPGLYERLSEYIASRQNEILAENPGGEDN